MGKNFWPIFIIIASLSVALSWKFIPAFRSGVTSSTDAARRCFTAFNDRMQELSSAGQVSEEEMKDISNVIRSFDESEDAAVVNKAYEKGERKLAPRQVATKPVSRTVTAAVRPSEDPVRVTPQPVAKTVTAAPRPATVAPAASFPAEAPPSTRGVVKAAATEASWAVLAQVTSVETTEGKSLGTVKGGRFFLIERVDESGPSQVYLIGNFTPKKMKESVQIPANHVFCFTGSPDDLSETQRHCLREYYELRGAAKEYREKLVREAGEKSPYFQQAAAAVEALRAKVKSFKNNPTSDENRKATYEISQLKQKVQELNAKHKAWKDAHAAEIPDPDEDPVYKGFLTKQRTFLAPIQEIAFR